MTVGMRSELFKFRPVSDEKKYAKSLKTFIESRKRSVEILKQHGAKTMK